MSQEQVIGLALFGFLVVAVVINVAVNMLGRKCRKCGKRRTFNWVHSTEDASHSDIIHVNVNRYCFSCCEFTERDDAALLWGNLNYSPFYHLALWHQKKHHPEEQNWMNGQPVPQEHDLKVWAVRRSSSNEVHYVGVHPEENWFMDYVAWTDRLEWIRVDDITHFRLLTKNESTRFCDALLKMVDLK